MSRAAVAGGAMAGLVGLLSVLLGARGEAAEALDGRGGLTISVPGIPGPYCMYGIEKRLRALPGMARIELRWREEEIRVEAAAGATFTPADLRAAVERAEYPYRYTVEP